MARPLAATLAVALALSGAACSEVTSADARSDLTASEVRSLAFGVSALAVHEVEDAVWAGAGVPSSLAASVSAAAHPGGGGPGGHGGPGGPGGKGGGWGIWGPRGLGIPGTTTVTTDRSTTCPQGGSTRSVTTVTTVVDTVARSGSVATESVETPDACAFPVDSLNTVLTTLAAPGTVITVTGAPSLVTRSSSRYSWAASDSTSHGGRLTRGATTGTQTGAFTYTTSDGRSGSCRVDLTTGFDPEAHTHSVTGTFCGEAVDLTASLPERRGGHGR